jgi:hypothetical protein
LVIAAAPLGVRGGQAWAQEKPEAKPAPAAAPAATTAPAATEKGKEDGYFVFPHDAVTRVFQLKNADLGSILGVLKMFSGRVNGDWKMRLVTWTGPKELAPAVEDIVKRLDVPAAPVPNVEVTFYLLRGSKQAGDGEPLPAELEGVAKQLKGTFALARLSLVDAAVIRARSGSEASSEGIFHGVGDPDSPANYRIRVDPVEVTSNEQGRVIRLSHLGFTLGMTVTTGSGSSLHRDKYQENLHTDIEFREGQKAVIGRTSAAGAGESLFLVVSGKIVE